MPCNVCNEMYHTMLLEGKIKQIPIAEKFENCPDCEARTRFKTFRLIYDQQVAPRANNKGNLRALVISGTAWEQSIISQNFSSFISSALYGNYGEGTVKSDMRNLKEFANEHFDYVHACNVLDYIPELNEVLSSVYRVLKPGGMFLFHIAEFRLTNTDARPIIKGTKREPYYPEGISLPNVLFGKHGVVECMRKNHYDAKMYEVNDIFSGEICTWFLGIK
ncbi:class I SAM-dependent methyltransferase [Paenibacillus xerothermodurans]|uniref:Class I SAM-dependent methyltransferase n=1 Tax=Paenibacillus xerothermodurans TaxID=1977292 RepID=A0A2W1N6P4_PAEXE|nr:methyltransferase domain-containing protein [Paenibacillus xerothermodurans]PZE20077.1 class I SAM-dependent methyltransferase [Paenibacillus xerothermodurans]